MDCRCNPLSLSSAQVFSADCGYTMSLSPSDLDGPAFQPTHRIKLISRLISHTSPIPPTFFSPLGPSFRGRPFRERIAGASSGLSTVLGPVAGRELASPVIGHFEEQPSRAFF
ncbi:hypothetical protein HGRIS_000061 [Hohenbuehelia grisea]|uniref:Uncharacterized protein n=1 Tax=Hohenbuehelia grisea TaxID=104357 RepID=A0ABR3JQW3_9AGAR